MPTEYKCCLCGEVSSRCTRKCIICSNGEKRFCDTCYGGRNKCLECRPLDNGCQDKKESTPKTPATENKSKRKRVSFSGGVNNNDDESRGELVATVQQPSPPSATIVPSEEAVVDEVVGGKAAEPVAAVATTGSASAPAKQHTLISSMSCALTNTTASQHAASALAELKKKQAGMAAVASNKNRELSKSAETEKIRQHEKDRDEAVGAIAAATQLQREREEAAAAAVVAAQQQQREHELAVAVVAAQQHAAAVVAAQLQREREEAAAAVAAQLQREREEAVAAVAAQQQRDHVAAVVAAQLQREREEAAAAVAAQLQREREEAVAAVAAQQQRDHAAAVVVAQLQREREEAAAAEAVAAQQQREHAAAAAAVVAAQLQREREEAAAAVVFAAQQQRERELAATAAVAVQQQREHAAAAAAAVVAAQLQREREEAASAVVVAAQLQREREEAAAAAVVVAQQQRERELTVAATVAAQQQREHDEVAAAIAAVAAQEQREREETAASSSHSPQQELGQEVDDTTVGTTRKVDPLIYRSISNWPCPPSYTYLDTYQGVHPWKRKHSQPHKYYPLCRIYEHLTNIGVAIIMWQIDSSTILEELTTTNAFQRLLIEASPILMWYRNAERPSEQIIANAFLSPPNSIHSNNLATAVVATTTTTINLVPESSNTVLALASPTTTSNPIQQHESNNSTPATVTINTVTDSVINLVDTVDQDDEKDISFPSSRRDYEKGMHQLLKVLYTEPFKVPYREVNIGGRTYQLDCFHYVDSTNSSQPEFNNKRGKKYEFVNRQGENATVYRWEIKMAIITSLRMSGTKYVDRVFFAFARYGSTSCDKKYDCCAVMIVRWVNRIPVFLMLEVGSSSSSGSTISDEVQSWEGYDRIKHFYVMPEVQVDCDKLSRARLKYWDMSRHLYDESRLIQIDTHRPGDMTVDRATTQQVETSWKMWAIKHGPRDILADVKIPVADRPPSRAVQIKEKAELKEAKSTITVKNVKISDLEKQVSKLQSQLKAIKASPAVASNKRDFQAAQDAEETHAPARKRAVVTASSSSKNGYTMSSPVVQPMMGIRSASTASISPVVMQQASPVVVEMTQELHKTELEYSIQQKKIQVLQLQLVAAQKQAAINDLRNDQTISKARHNLELTGIHNDQREQQQAARSRQNYINDEDRAFQKESIRRQWQVEDRQVATSKILDMATKANELPMLQTLLSSQSSNTALVAAHHPMMRSQQLNAVFTPSMAKCDGGGMQSSAAPAGIKPAQTFPPPKWLPHPAPPPPPPPEEKAPPAPEDNTVDEGDEDFSQYGEEELSARLLQIQSELAVEYSKQGSI